VHFRWTWQEYIYKNHTKGLFSNPLAVYVPFTYIHTHSSLINNATFLNTVKGLDVYTGQTSLSAEDNYNIDKLLLVQVLLCTYWRKILTIYTNTEWSFYLWTHEVTSHPACCRQCLWTCFTMLSSVLTFSCDNVCGVRQQRLLLLNSMSLFLFHVKLFKFSWVHK
jgi:hypothetical protein